MGYLLCGGLKSSLKKGMVGFQAALGGKGKKAA
jgi:hypothetical protein